MIGVAINKVREYSRFSMETGGVHDKSEGEGLNLAVSSGH